MSLIPKMNNTTYCTVVDQVLTTKVCPLAKGSCYWQHRVTNECCFTEVEVTPEAFSALTGSDPVTAPEIEEFKSRLREAL